jgi:clan AA aspartic protease (TIGR02281 family)
MKHKIDIYDSKIIVTPAIEGVDETVTIKFLLDTGATRSLIDEQVAVQLGFDVNKLDRGDRLITAGGAIYSKKLNLPKFTLFGEDFINFKVDVVKLPLQILLVSEGILGMDFLLKFKTIKFDFDRQTIELDSD